METNPNHNPCIRPRLTAIIATGCAILVVLFVFTSRPNKPFLHHGKPLNDWLAALNGPMEGRVAANNAILEMGTNIVPRLIEMRFARESRSEKTLGRFIRLVWRDYQSRTERGRYMAFRGLRTLGGLAAPFLIPHLSSDVFASSEQRMYTDHLATEASDVLFSDIGPPSVPAVLTALTNADATIRYHACYTIAFHPYDNILNSAVLGPLAPAVAERLQDTDYRVRWMAIRSAEIIARHSKSDAPDLLSNLCQRLDDPVSSVRYSSATILSLFKKDAQMAVPHLLSAYAREKEINTNTVKSRIFFGNRTFIEVQQALTNALWQIDPVAAAKAGF